ncbi:hypothetical protein G3M83_06440 [Rouxiella badensis]|uniref:hypothetical protein n=1 Tax=Rouxiella badensis TaxID=1646377 RepID=UPI0013EF1A1E|nr:hypothetical protein [Rouxiella badensis]QII37360.1 hypothetical protein G3M83_06440 [Rouxiella badensis]
MALTAKKIDSSYQITDTPLGSPVTIEAVDGNQYLVGQRIIESPTEIPLGTVVAMVNINDLELNTQADGSVTAEQASQNQAEAIKRNNVALNALLNEWHALISYMGNYGMRIPAPKTEE